MAGQKKIEQSFQKLSDYLAHNDFKGYEYDDLLASPFVNTLTFNSLWLKIIAVQVSKRFFINVRPLLGVPKLHSTKAFGFIVKGYLCHYLATGDDRYIPTVKKSLQWLMDHASKGYSGYCWGNDFDFASRAGYFKKELPTIVWSAHIQESFELAYKVLGDEIYKEVVIRVADFTEKDLERIHDDSGFCIAYAPGIKAQIHNSNLLAVATLLRGWKYSHNPLYFETAKNAVNWTLQKQNPDGSWYYGAVPMLHWIDNYHTGYNLDCFCTAQNIAGKDFVSDEVIDSTYQYWKKNFFEPDGQPKFYNNSLYPADIQACAQAIESFSKYSIREADAGLHAQKIAEWTVANMQKPNGSFRYRIYKHWTYNLEAIHWGQATMLSSLGHLLYYFNKTLKNDNPTKLN